MRYLMLIWADADAAGGDESDLKAWVDFDEEVKNASAFVVNDLPSMVAALKYADRLPTYGCVEVRQLLQY